ncbi:hypothetical protein TNCV_2705651 [Trichonephila clavipes]|nr:hypothetical protein TNCV_2705651 [Trichonephila clavipes]
MVRREREEEKGERGHRVTSVKKLDNFPRLRLVNMPNFRLGLNFPPYLGTLSTVVSGAVANCGYFSTDNASYHISTLYPLTGRGGMGQLGLCSEPLPLEKGGSRLCLDWPH